MRQSPFSARGLEGGARGPVTISETSFSPVDLTPFVPRVVVDWLRVEPEARHRRLEGTLAFVDISGFTALNERLMKAQEEERIRIAGELHDGVMQQMLAATMMLGTR